MPIRRKTKIDNMEDLSVLIERAKDNLKKAPEHKKAVCAAKLKELLETKARNS